MTGPGRTTYRHGDLKRALLDAGIRLAREGGPGAVILREATRIAGVAPNAAYRHYTSREELLQAVRSAALSALAISIERHLALIKRNTTLEERAKAELRAVGTGYVAFARAEPGLFRTAFSVPEDPALANDQSKTGASGLSPFGLLGAALDKFVQAGLLSDQDRVGAEYLAWSTVHGFAFLIIDGPLRRLNEAQVKRLLKRILGMVEKGLP